MIRGKMRSVQQRHSIRLKGYDYAQAGAYFVTICVQSKESLFGSVANDEMTFNDAGQMIAHWWVELSNKFPSVDIDEFIVMPNHFHGIIIIHEQVAHAGAPLRESDVGAHLRVRPGSLPQIVQWFKTMTTNNYIRGVKQHNWKPFDGKLWQRNYYERIVRNEHELNRARQYVLNNPLQWALDKENPLNKAL